MQPQSFAASSTLRSLSSSAEIFFTTQGLYYPWHWNNTECKNASLNLPSLFSGSPSSSAWLSLLVLPRSGLLFWSSVWIKCSLAPRRSSNRWVLHHLATQLSSSVDGNESSKLLEESPDKVVEVFMSTITPVDLDSRTGARQNSPIQWA